MPRGGLLELDDFRGFGGKHDVSVCATWPATHMKAHSVTPMGIQRGTRPSWQKRAVLAAPAQQADCSSCPPPPMSLCSQARARKTHLGAHALGQRVCVQVPSNLHACARLGRIPKHHVRQLCFGSNSYALLLLIAAGTGGWRACSGLAPAAAAPSKGWMSSSRSSSSLKTQEHDQAECG